MTNLFKEEIEILESNIIKFEYKFYRKFILDTIVNFAVLCMPTLVFLFSFLIIGFSVINIAIIIMITSLQLLMCSMIPYIIRYFKTNFLDLKVIFLISNEQFQISLCDRVYIQYSWKNIKELQLSEERFWDDSLFYLKKNYKLKILENNNNIDNIRLYLLRFKRKTLQKIIYELISHSKNFNIAFIETGFEKGIEEERHDEFIKLQNIVKKIKSDLKQIKILA